ncbi:unnamed protein product, partial [Didymodactylos carnosus]
YYSNTPLPDDICTNNYKVQNSNSNIDKSQFKLHSNTINSKCDSEEERVPFYPKLHNHMPEIVEQKTISYTKLWESLFQLKTTTSAFDQRHYVFMTQSRRNTLYTNTNTDSYARPYDDITIVSSSTTANDTTKTK